MSERFTMCHEQNDKIGWTMSIVDWETDQPFDYTQYEVHSSSITDTKDEMEDLCLLLNQMNEENIALKSSNMEYEDGLARLEEENEQLKQQVEDLEFKLRTIEAYDRTVNDEYSDSVYDFKKKLKKW